MPCKLLRCKRFLPIEKITSEKNPKTSTINADIINFGSTRNTSDIAYSNDTYNGN